MAVLRLVIFILLLSLASPPTGSAASESGRLVKIVALSRHGVRAPTQSAQTLALWSQKTWPSWPVARGQLTPRGAELITGMWSALRDSFIGGGFLPDQACPDPSLVYVRADVDERTKATARAILNGLAPNCKTGFSVAEGKVDPLFHPVKAGLYHYNPIPVATDVLSMTPDGLTGLQEDFSGALSLMSKIVGPPSPTLCSRFTFTPNCLLEDLPNAISVSSDGKSVNLVGSLGIASSIAEIFLLEYGQWPDEIPGWGQVDKTVLSQLLPIHSRVFDVVNRAPVIAWANGSSLLNDMSLALFGKHYDERCNKAKLVVFVGHDTNLANIGGLLGFNWQASGYPFNDIPPGGALFLELWEKDGEQRVAARFYAQPPQVLHSPFTGETNGHAPVGVAVSAPPMSGEARFGADEFIQRVNQATAGAPIAPKSTPPFNYDPVIPDFNK